MNANKLEKLARWTKDPDFIDLVMLKFFKAMNDGYASGIKANKVTILRILGAKVVIYRNKPFTVIDLWFVTGFSTFSWGMTVILCEGFPVWVMQYYGHYQKATLPFLKEALRSTYKLLVFRGGRGDETFESDTYTYSNAASGSFSDFSGYESIRERESGQSVGFHRYHGGALLN